MARHATSAFVGCVRIERGWAVLAPIFNCLRRSREFATTGRQHASRREDVSTSGRFATLKGRHREPTGAVGGTLGNAASVTGTAHGCMKPKFSSRKVARSVTEAQCSICDRKASTICQGGVLRGMNHGQVPTVSAPHGEIFGDLKRGGLRQFGRSAQSSWFLFLVFSPPVMRRRYIKRARRNGIVQRRVSHQHPLTELHECLSPCVCG
jgi:hypothetical protein